MFRYNRSLEQEIESGFNLWFDVFPPSSEFAYMVGVWSLRSAPKRRTSVGGPVRSSLAIELACCEDINFFLDQV